MSTNSYTPALKLQTLTEEQIEKIHLASLEILEDPGTRILHDRARELLCDHGAIESKGDIVRIPASLVENALASAPELVILFDRHGKPVMRLGGRNVYFGTGSDTPQTLDPKTKEVRKSRKKDSFELARLVDALKHIDFVMSMAIADDYPGTSSFVHQFEAMLSGTTKPLVYTAQGLKDIQPIYEMMLALRGSAGEVSARPFAILYSEPISPLVHTKEGMEMLLFCAEHRIPVVYPTGSMAGGTAPVTLAGALALGNAECLAGLVLTQLAAPGTPFIYGGNVTAMDMHWASYTYASPEFHTAFSAFGDLAHYYRLPVWGLAGAADSKTLDAQAGAEAAHQILLALLSGENLVHDVGYLGSGMISSMEMILLCDELIGMLRQATLGIDIDDETLALDVIREVGAGGHFLLHEHTLKHCPEIWMPSFFNRAPLEHWKSAGKKDIFETLNSRVHEILARHEVPELEKDVRREIEGILREREKLA
ncbi:MAG TPA: trimethylamine methyltransferase family protein [archaeon]|nr:trimethylamine methyltransferase family protein [archaeon]